MPNEQALIEAFVALVRKWDPDIFVGYEVGVFKLNIFVLVLPFLPPPMEHRLNRMLFVTTDTPDLKCTQFTGYFRENSPV